MIVETKNVVLVFSCAVDAEAEAQYCTKPEQRNSKLHGKCLQAWDGIAAKTPVAELLVFSALLCSARRPHLTSGEERTDGTFLSLFSWEEVASVDFLTAARAARLLSDWRLHVCSLACPPAHCTAKEVKLHSKGAKKKQIPSLADVKETNGWRLEHLVVLSYRSSSRRMWSSSPSLFQPIGTVAPPPLRVARSSHPWNGRTRRTANSVKCPPKEN